LPRSTAKYSGIVMDSSRAAFRILLVEDSDDDAELLEAWLRRAGLDFSLVRAQTEPEFLAALGDGAADVVLCDFRLPRFSPWRVLQLLQARGGPLPVVIVSHDITEPERELALEKGAKAVVRKDRMGEGIPVILAVLQRTREGP
jgi:CheY-like chemotaxis protein